MWSISNLNNDYIFKKFQYNICTCGAISKDNATQRYDWISIQHLYMWSVVQSPVASVFIVFQYNICTCGACLALGWRYCTNKFQYNICTCGAKKCKWYLWNFRISIQHLYMWSAFSTTPITKSLLISIQHLYMWSPVFEVFGVLELAISIQHLYMWSEVPAKRVLPGDEFQYNICTCGAYLFPCYCKRF